MASKVKETMSKEGEQKTNNEFQTSNSKSQTRVLWVDHQDQSEAFPPAILT